MSSVTWQQLLLPAADPPPTIESFIIPPLAIADHVTNTQTSAFKNPTRDDCLPAILLDGTALPHAMISRLKAMLPTDQTPSPKSIFEWNSCQEDLVDITVRSEGEVKDAAIRIIKFVEKIRRELVPNSPHRFRTRSEAFTTDGSVKTDILVIDENAVKVTEKGIDEGVGSENVPSTRKQGIVITTPTIAWENKTDSVFSEHIPNIPASFGIWGAFNVDDDEIGGPASIAVKVGGVYHFKANIMTLSSLDTSSCSTILIRHNGLLSIVDRNS